MKVSHWAAALGTVLCAVTLAACGGGSGSGAESGASREEAGLAFAQCMRAHGVEVEDPKSGKSITIESDDPKTKSALAACDDKLGDQGQELSSEEGEEFKEGVLAFTECMREEGIPMGDPEFLGPGKFHFDISKVDTSSPGFEAAAEACKDKFPELSEEGVYIGG